MHTVFGLENQKERDHLECLGREETKSSNESSSNRIGWCGLDISGIGHKVAGSCTCGDKTSRTI